jgi:hypothetical protein
MTALYTSTLWVSILSPIPCFNPMIKNGPLHQPSPLLHIFFNIGPSRSKKIKQVFNLQNNEAGSSEGKGRKYGSSRICSPVLHNKNVYDAGSWISISESGLRCWSNFCLLKYIIGNRTLLKYYLKLVRCSVNDWSPTLGEGQGHWGAMCNKTLFMKLLQDFRLNWWMFELLLHIANLHALFWYSGSEHPRLDYEEEYLPLFTSSPPPVPHTGELSQKPKKITQ